MGKVTMYGGNFASYQLVGQRHWAQAWAAGRARGQAEFTRLARLRSAERYAYKVFAPLHLLLMSYERTYGIEIDQKQEAYWGYKYRNVTKKHNKGDSLVPAGWIDNPGPHFDKTKRHPFTEREAEIIYDALYNKPAFDKLLQTRIEYRIANLVNAYNRQIPADPPKVEEPKDRSVDDIISRYKSLEHFCKSFKLVSPD